MNSLIYTQLPHTVTADQWFPYKKLPCVVPQFRKIDDKKSSKAIKIVGGKPMPCDDNSLTICVSAKVTLASGEEIDVLPTDYVLYSPISFQPVKVLTERVFLQNYLDQSKFCLCDECSSKVAKLTGLDKAAAAHFDSIRKLLEEGKPQQFGEILLNTPADLDDFLTRMRG